MQVLIFDPFSGASGDMIIASLVDLGADATVVREAMESAADVSVSVGRVIKRGIGAVNVKVKVTTENEHSRSYLELIDEIKS
ncbi:MAG: DUF111 family protein, partial [Methanosarcinaceae archaeon]|nr:DUF111 family protein [Methanosarcinaceae archaeon]